MKDNLKGVGIWGCGCPVDTSAAGRSTDRAGSETGAMNNIRERVTETVNTEVVFV